MPAANYLAKLGEQGFTTSDEMVTALMSAARGPAAISRMKQSVHLSLCAIPTIFLLAFGLFSVYQQLSVARTALGIKLAPLTPELASRVGASKGAHGFFIEAVAPDSRAANAGLEPGDILEEINRRPVQTGDELHEAVTRSAGTPLLALVNRDGNNQFVTVSVSAARSRQNIASANIAELVACLDRLATLEDYGVPSTNVQYRALEVYIAGQYRDLISNPLTWSATLLAQPEFSSQWRTLAERVITAWPSPDEADVAEATRSLGPFLENIRRVRLDGPRTGTFVWRLLWLHAMLGLMVAGMFGLLSAITGRGGIALRLMGVAVVRKNGTVASGSRARLRSALSWLPILAMSAAVFAGHSPLMTATPLRSPLFAVRVLFLPPLYFLHQPSILFVRVAIITVAVTVFALSVIAAVIWPERSLQDRLAGTWLVPR